jgi:hypothetical protein
MAEVKILDLDDFAPQDREIKIGGKNYLINGATTLKMTIVLMKAAQDWQKKPDDPEVIEKLIQSTKAFFKEGIADDVLYALDLKTQFPKLIRFLYGMTEAEENKAIGAAEKNADSQLPK